ncbi:expressed unknown protein [Seminavis robusta]|uniref:Uncharacterized protein n=1 Tax=Seminavis robusta TaxID=568900 RepID=A0A9N8HKE7_9STRA|nr:expressed unknown protein [Seminavis robusta]|eukprot:Sro725_g193370.2  (261) ;mRNA; r:41508-42380
MKVASKKCETKVSQFLHRRGEWGRGRDLPRHRKEEIAAACARHGMTMHQALSLRRTMLRSFKGGMGRVTHSSSMGGAKGQQQAATLFEKAVEAYLRTTTVGYQDVFLTEAELLAEMKAGRRRRGPTPDILFTRPVSINGHLVKWVSLGRKSRSTAHTVVSQQYLQLHSLRPFSSHMELIYDVQIDAKLFYASAMYAHNSKLPNGKLQAMAQRFNEHFGGKGAFVFGQGFCVDLKKSVTGALLLDATPLDLTDLNAFQDAS